MNNEQKMKRLLEMQEHPECYTEEEIRQLLADKECRQMYEQMVRATDAMFAEKHKSHALTKHPTVLYKILCRAKRPLRLRWLATKGTQESRAAAAFIGLLMLSGIAYAAIHIVSNSRSQQTETAADTTAVASSKRTTTNFKPKVADSIPQTRIFENAPLDDMITEIAQYYNKVADIENEDAHELRLYYKWEPKDALEDVVADLNHFDHVNLAIEGDKLIVKP